MTIRPIHENDFFAWFHLWDGYNSFYKRSISLDITIVTWQRFLNPDEPIFALVAEEEEQLLGLVHFLFHRSTSALNNICYLQDLFTDESARGQGIGKALIEAVYEKARESGSPRVYWQTHENNEVAKALYDRVAEYSGFVVYRKLL